MKEERNICAAKPPKPMPPLMNAIENLSCTVDRLTEHVNGIRESLQISWPVENREMETPPSCGVIGVRTTTIHGITARIECLFEDLDHIRKAVDEI